MLTDLNKLVGF